MKLFLGIGVISAPVIVALGVINIIKPLKEHRASFDTYNCPDFVSCLFHNKKYTTFYSLIA